MVLLAAVGMASFMLVSLVLGIRLVALSRRTQELPELAMGLAFLLCGALGYGQMVSAFLVWEAHPHLTPIFLASGYLMLDLGAICLLLFTWWVFRRGQRRGKILFFGLAASIVGAFVGRALLEGFVEPRLHGPLAFLGVFTLGAAFVWPAYESLRYYAMLRRRERVGLADPKLARTFFWWGAGAVSASCIFLTLLVVAALGIEDATAPAAAVPTAFFGGLAAWSIARAFARGRHGVAASREGEIAKG